MRRVYQHVRVESQTQRGRQCYRVVRNYPSYRYPSPLCDWCDSEAAAWVAAALAVTND